MTVPQRFSGFQLRGYQVWKPAEADFVAWYRRTKRLRWRISFHICSASLESASVLGLQPRLGEGIVRQGRQLASTPWAGSCTLFTRRQAGADQSSGPRLWSGCQRLAGRRVRQELCFSFRRRCLGLFACFLCSTCRFSVEVHIRGHISTGSGTIPRLQGDGGRVQVAQQV